MLELQKNACESAVQHADAQSLTFCEIVRVHVDDLPALPAEGSLSSRPARARKGQFVSQIWQACEDSAARVNRQPGGGSWMSVGGSHGCSTDLSRSSLDSKTKVGNPTPIGFGRLARTAAQSCKSCRSVGRVSEDIARCRERKADLSDPIVDKRFIALLRQHARSLRSIVA